MKLLREHINEEFKEEVDPITAMDIGMLRVIKDFTKKQFPSSGTENWSYSQLFRNCVSNDKIDFVNYFLDEGLVDVHEDGEAALRIAVYHEKYDMAMNLISKGANIEKAMEFSREKNEQITSYHFLHLNIMLRDKKKIHEEFKENSDPVEDLGIGLLHHISYGLKKLKTAFGVEFISLEKYFSDAWAVEVRYNNPYNKKGIIDEIKKCLGEELFKNIGTRLYGEWEKVIGAALIKKEYMQAFNKVLDDVGNIKDF